MAKLREAILLLVERNPLPPRYKDHPLGGEWKHFRDCQIEPDRLIYKIDGEDLHLVRTGTHTDPFLRVAETGRIITATNGDRGVADALLPALLPERALLGDAGCATAIDPR